MNVRNLLTATAIVCALAACATPYQERGMMGGFSESQLGPRIWRVNFISNPGRTRDEVKDMILLRAAELVSAAGFDRFVVASASDQTLVTGFVGVTAGGGGLLASLFTPMRNPDVSAVIEARARSLPREIEYDPAFLLRNLGPKYGVSTTTPPRAPNALNADAPPTVAAVVKAPTSPPAPEKKPPAVIGQDSVGAERVGRDIGCTRDTLATMIGKGPGYETYSLQCTNGETLIVRCDFGNCRAMK
jgi:hypothetical protein